LRKAIASALAQTHSVLEVIIAADTLDAIHVPSDPRVRILRVGPGAGGNVARQSGIESAKGELIGLLDDDDEWLPEKLAEQLRLVEQTVEGDRPWIASCRVAVSGHEKGPAVWPDALKSPGETLVEYLFLKRRVRGGTGFIQASCLLFPTQLALKTPFDRQLKFHQDVSWLVDLSHAHPTLAVVQPAVPLSVYLVTPGTGSVSQSIKADASVDWAIDRLSADGRRVLGDFILTQSLLLARRAGSLSGVLRILITGLRVGRPGGPAVAYALISVVKVALARMSGRRVIG
jgi:glycosyltransferase involved in cell wall biosynthesis